MTQQKTLEDFETKERKEKLCNNISNNPKSKIIILASAVPNKDRTAYLPKGEKNG